MRRKNLILIKENDHSAQNRGFSKCQRPSVIKWKVNCDGQKQKNIQLKMYFNLGK